MRRLVLLLLLGSAAREEPALAKAKNELTIFAAASLTAHCNRELAPRKDDGPAPPRAQVARYFGMGSGHHARFAFNPSAEEDAFIPRGSDRGLDRAEDIRRTGGQRKRSAGKDRIPRLWRLVGALP